MVNTDPRTIAINSLKVEVQNLKSELMKAYNHINFLTEIANQKVYQNQPQLQQLDNTDQKPQTRQSLKTDYPITKKFEDADNFNAQGGF